ncbi:MAG: guanylate kinase [Duncaniella sp.]|nr:guanylate kinase [Duncaniella sp.]
MDKTGKIIIISAPSGTGKSTIVGRLIDGGDLDMQFSISATNRAPRGEEKDGVHYYFLSTPRFQQAITEGAFVEYEEVYPGRYYGTLRSEIDRITREGHNVILDIDVKGGVNVKRLFGTRALSLFIEPPSVDELRRRLEGRGTDSREAIEERLAKAEYELTFAPQFDTVIVNDQLEQAVEHAHEVIRKFVDS